jgi:ubiquinone/menaquinone biosynthesis C-methylase UbiE
MADVVSSGPNAAESEGWNGSRGESWLRQYEVVGEQLAPLGERVMDHLAVSAGERVMDIGCGTGETTRALGRRVEAGGSVLGVDISALLLDVARQRAAADDADNLAFTSADAQTHGFDPASFDALYSRFGVMFFADPAAAFANLRAALRTGGRLAFVCWRTPAENPFMTLPTRVGMAFMDPPPRPDPLAPGPFAFADADRIRRILADAGFTDVTVAPFDDSFGGPEAAARLVVVRREPLAGLLRDADAATRAKIDAAVDEALAPFTRDGRVVLPAATWLVSARNP